MKADLYVQGHFWATIVLPGDSLLALLGKGMISEATRKAEQLKADFHGIGGVKCSIHLHLQGPVTYDPGEGDCNDPFRQENNHADYRSLPLVPPAPTPHP